MKQSTKNEGGVGGLILFTPAPVEVRRMVAHFHPFNVNILISLYKFKC